jgi:hypothetical protein
MTRKAMKGNSSHANRARIERGVLDFIHTTFPILVTSSLPLEEVSPPNMV